MGAFPNLAGRRERAVKIFTDDEWEYLCSKINWNKSFLDAKAVRIMNKPANQEEPVK